MTAADRDGYKRTLFDKYGPEGGDYFKIASWLIVPIVAGGGIGAAWFVRKGFGAGWVIAGALLGAILGAAGMTLVALTFSQAGGGLFGSFIQPGGTAMDRQYSLEDAMVMRGDVEGALASYERIILESPNDAQPRRWRCQGTPTSTAPSAADSDRGRRRSSSPSSAPAAAHRVRGTTARLRP